MSSKGTPRINPTIEHMYIYWVSQKKALTFLTDAGQGICEKRIDFCVESPHGGIL